jgi:gamma-glutamylcyclotransferase (GGCT)/AIG2-like uncharacterized protein YtfP
MRFFFYGTLIAGSGNPVARLVHDRLRAIGPAEARGLLVAVPDPDGWYPALLPGEGVVRGMLYEATETFTAADLARLDAYEDCDPLDREGSLYLREELEAIMPGGRSVAAEAYRFVGPLPEGSRPIVGGDFRAWLAENGLAPFAGG